MEGEGRKAAIPHVSALDGARGLAVAGVLLFHGGHLTGGYLGVDFFFTLSGFLITSLLLAESSRTGSVGLGGFWARRARRLLPALAVLMVGVAIYSVALAKPAELTQIRGDAFATLAYVANWHSIFAHQSYFALFAAPSPLNHTWSLAIEEQFYVIWPLLFVGLLTRFRRAAPQAVLAVSLALAAISSALMIVLYDPANTNRVYFGTDTRAAAILLGAALAAWLAIHGPVTKRNTRIALETVGIAGAITLAIAWTRLDGQSSTLYRGGFLLCGLAATAIIAAAVHPKRGPIAWALSFKPLCALGLISYGVYLYHWPLDVILNQTRVHVHGWPLFLVQTAVTLAVAIASYKLLEQPIRHGQLTSTQLRKLTPAIALGLVIALFATTNGASSPVAGSTPSNGKTVELAAAIRKNAAPPGSRRVLLVGNSTAYYIGPAFEAIHTNPPLAVFNASVTACTFPPQIIGQTVKMRNGARVRRLPCDPPWEAAVVKAFLPQVVFWMDDDPPHGGGTYLGRRIDPCSQAYDSLYQRTLTREVAVLAAAGAKVVITTSAYSGIVGYADYRADDCQNALKRAVAAHTGAQLVDLANFICPHRRCRKKQDGITLRPDEYHYYGPGGEIVAKWLIDQVR
ncbi:MAG TPA: acyltransferase [Acidimicrobiia bacterium]